MHRRSADPRIRVIRHAVHREPRTGPASISERERERDGRIIFLHRGSARGRAINLSVAKAEDRAEVNRADQRSVKITLPRVALAIV